VIARFDFQSAPTRAPQDGGNRPGAQSDQLQRS
jgi:hypothetical protein